MINFSSPSDERHGFGLQPRLLLMSYSKLRLKYCVVQTFDKIVADIVKEDYRTADVFKKYNINYCCAGTSFLSDVCARENLDFKAICAELTRVTQNVYLSHLLLFDTWNIEFLIDYILHVHHAYFKAAIPPTQLALQSYAASHAKTNPQIKELEDNFNELAKLLTVHSMHEEDVIFPYIKQIEVTHRRKEVYGSLFVRTLRKPLDNLQKDQTIIAALLSKIRLLTNNYETRPEACTIQKVCYLKLKEFDNDLVQHIHLENNILYPKALQLENELLQIQTQ